MQEAILTEASLGYLGFGIQPPYPTLGNMLNESQSYFLLAPWFTILPGLMILFLVYKINQISKKYQEKKVMEILKIKNLNLKIREKEDF